MVSLPPSLTERCARPSPDNVWTIGALASYSVQQDAALLICDGKRQAVVDIVTAVNGINRPRPWWKIWE